VHEVSLPTAGARQNRHQPAKNCNFQVAHARIMVALVSGWRLQLRRVGRPEVACLRPAEPAMLDKLIEQFLALLSLVPALFVEPNSPNFGLVRAMFGLIIIVIIVYLIAMRPFRLAIRSCMRKVSDLFVRKP
jgi:hypothetical protein